MKSARFTFRFSSLLVLPTVVVDWKRNRTVCQQSFKLTFVVISLRFIACFVFVRRRNLCTGVKWHLKSLPISSEHMAWLWCAITVVFAGSDKSEASGI